MKILVRSATLDGELISDSGEAQEAAECLDIGELMRGQSACKRHRNSHLKIISALHF